MNAVWTDGTVGEWGEPEDDSCPCGCCGCGCCCED